MTFSDVKKMSVVNRPKVELLREGPPLHLQIKSAISSGLKDGIWRPGDRLPTEVELSREFGVSEGTVRQAVIALVKEGRLTRRSGKGTFAARPNFQGGFARFFRFCSGTQIGKQAYRLHVLKIATATNPDPEIRKQLHLGHSSKILAIHRTIEQNGVVVVHYVSYLPQRGFGVMKRDKLENLALYDVMESRCGVHVVRVVDTLRARAANSEDAVLLRVKRATPVIAIDRLAYTYGDRVVEVRRGVGRSDVFAYEIEIR